MFKMKRFFHLVLAAVMLLSCIQVPSAYAADTPTTVTVNVTNAPVRGDIALERTACSWFALRMKRMPTAIPS